jgi:ribonuclease HI
MSRFECTVCGAAFSLPKATLARYPNWTPKHCRKCSPKKKRQQQSAKAPREENVTVAAVLARHTGGPQTGVFSDGSCWPNPGPGGWGVVWVDSGEIVKQAYGHEVDTTNNRMELRGLIEGLQMLPIDTGETLFTDSKLCVNILETWAVGWEKNGWKRKTGPIKNLDLVQQAWSLRKARPQARVEWIAAHAGHRWNEYADALASASTRETL